MKIFVTGTRGIPNIPGGVEKHCEELYHRIVKRGHEVLIACRRSYVSEKVPEWQGVKLLYCYTPRAKSFEALVHTFFALLKALRHNPAVVHIHADGPSLFTPLARLMGFKVVVTNHGPEYDRQKWGKMAKLFLRLGEKMGGLYASEVIVISSLIGNIIWRRCKRESNLIYNGVPIPRRSVTNNYLAHIGVDPNKYLLAVARFVPEKGLHDLIDAFKATKFNYKLVIAGDADHETDYSKRLRQLAAEDDRIVLTGYITGEPLNQVYSHALLFVLPSYHEGLPISLLEAMSFGLPVLVSDIGANMEVNLPKYRYFKCGDVSDLKTKINSLIDKKLPENERIEIQKQIEETYNWEKIATQTIAVYEKAIGAN